MDTPAQPKRSTRSPQRRLERLLEQIASGARHCVEIERHFGENPPPALETLLKIYRVLILKLSAEAEQSEAKLKLALSLLKPVLEGARLEEQRRERELAEQKYRDQREANQSAANRQPGGDALTPQTLEKIESELRLL